MAMRWYCRGIAGWSFGIEVSIVSSHGPDLRMHALAGNDRGVSLNIFVFFFPGIFRLNAVGIIILEGSLFRIEALLVDRFKNLQEVKKAALWEVRGKVVQSNRT